MCGIAGLVDFKKSTSEDILREMTLAVAHRGPDGQGIYCWNKEDAFIGFGHRRLSIIDLSNAASQPMHYDGLSIVFNGEIYNYNEIRNLLIGKGHQFISHSDTEVILHSWREWGEDAIRLWHGMFAIALHDEKTNEIICIRDRAGVKPFFYYNTGDLFLFGSELKSLTRHPGFTREINPSAVSSFLQYGYISHPHCIYRNTFKLKPGHLFRFSLSTREISEIRYWNVYDAYNKPKLSIGLQEAIDQTEIVLENAFQYRMVSDVPVGVFLSGGYDSTCVTALLQKGNMEKIKTFTIGNAEQKLDEAPFAKKVACHLGTDHMEYYCTAKEACDIIPDLPYFYDEPFADSSAIPTILVSRLARTKVTVALSADAGDEIFAGYNRYDYIYRYANKIGAIPKPLRKMAVMAMSTISSESIPYLRNRQNFHSRYDKMKNLLNDPSPSELLKNLSIVFTDAEVGALLKQPCKSLVTAHNSKELGVGYADPLSYMMAIDYQTYMVDDILQKVDRATMSVNLEGREPFLDQDIIEWAAQLPSHYKYHNGEKKFLLKRIVNKYVPKELMERPKMGFGIPIDQWLSNELRGLVEEYLSVKRLEAHGLFNVSAVSRTVRDFFNGRREMYLKVWYLLMFQMWYDKWLG